MSIIKSLLYPIHSRIAPFHSNMNKGTYYPSPWYVHLGTLWIHLLLLAFPIEYFSNSNTFVQLWGSRSMKRRWWIRSASSWSIDRTSAICFTLQIILSCYHSHRGFLCLNGFSYLHHYIRYPFNTSLDKLLTEAIWYFKMPLNFSIVCFFATVSAKPYCSRIVEMIYDYNNCITPYTNMINM